MFEITERPTDVVMSIEAESIEELFADAGRGFASLLVENPEAVAGREAVHIDLQAQDLGALLHDWLAELLFIFTTRGLVMSEFDVQIQGARLSAMAYGELFDPIRHLKYLHVKAITYHELKVQRLATHWHGHVTIDI